MRFLTTGVFGAWCTLLFSPFVFGQVTVNSTCGYSVTVYANPIQVIPNGNASWGYNYDITFNYTIIVSGTIPTWCNASGNGPAGGTLNNVQLGITCYGDHVFGYNLPKTSSSGTATTNNNKGIQFNSLKPGYSLPSISSANVTPAILNCGGLQLTISGPGITSQVLPLVPGALPVELLNFNAEAINQKVNLKWITASERDNDYFILEKTDDNENLELVAQIGGAGNSAIQTDYSFTDNSPFNGVSYYRLTQVDFNGEKHVFPPVSVEVQPSKINTKVYPNPTSDSHINLDISESGTVVMNIYNLYGQLLKTQTIESHSGNISESIGLPQQGNAFFMELIQNGSLVGWHKILKTNSQ